MMREESLAVFSYAFPHRKTQDFLFELALAGYRRVTVIAAPWKKLSHSEDRRYFPISLSNATPADPRVVSETLGFKFHQLEHDELGAIRALRDANGFELGIIAGARILKRPVINLFKEGVLNLHPGRIPETSGLDLFYYTIIARVPIGATAHFIDGRVDAGELLFFEETPLSPGATPEIVQHNNYQTQIRALRRFIAERDAGLLMRTPADRPKKNPPMTPEEKHAALAQFPVWLDEQIHRQREGA